MGVERYVNIAFEDALSEVLLERVIATNPKLLIAKRLSRGGFGYLKANFASLAKAADVIPLILLTDLDNAECAPSLISSWKARVGYVSPDLHMRVAVREAEAWVLGDEQGVSRLLDGASLSLPQNVDQLSDPKATLLHAAQKAKRERRDLLTRQTPAGPAQGVGYNTILTAFVRSDWNLHEASERSDSLQRAVRAIGAL